MLLLPKLLGVVLVLSSSLAPGQINDDCHRRSVVVEALDMPGLPIKGLDITSFKGTYRGRPANILSSKFVEGSAPRVVVLLDTSGSMRGGRLDYDRNKWKTAVTAASQVVSSTPPGTQISLFTFAGTVEKRFGLASEHKAIEEWLGAKSSQDISELKGRTTLYKAIQEALTALEPAQLGDAIYVITDGGENDSAESKSQVGRVLQASGVRLFAFLLNDGPTVDPAEDRGRLDLHDLVLGSGGSETTVGPRPSPATVYTSYDYDDRVVARIRAWTQLLEAEIGNFYVLQIETPQSSSRRENWELEVVDAQGRKKKDVRVVHPHPLAGCGARSANR